MTEVRDRDGTLLQIGDRIEGFHTLTDAPHYEAEITGFAGGTLNLVLDYRYMYERDLPRAAWHTGGMDRADKVRKQGPRLGDVERILLGG